MTETQEIKRKGLNPTPPFNTLISHTSLGKKQFSTFKKDEIFIQHQSIEDFQDFLTAAGQSVNIHNWIMMKRLTINYKMGYNSIEQHFKLFGKFLTFHCKNLQDLSLSLNGHNITSPVLQNLAISLAQLNQIKKLHLEVFSYQGSLNTGFRAIMMDSFSQLLNLEYFSLKIQNCKFSDELMELFTRRAGKMRLKLKNLSLSFNNCELITDKGLESLNFYYLNQLDSLKLSFNYCKLLTDNGFKKLFINMGKNGDNLKLLSIKILNCEKLSDDGLETFGTQIQNRFKNLRLLTFKVNYVSITDNGLTKFGSLVSKRQQSLIQKLKLDFNYCQKTTEKGLEQLGSQLKTCLGNLSQFSLKYSMQNKPSDKIIQSLVSVIANNLKNVRYLSLEFTSLQINSKTLMNFISQIGRSLEKLEGISLSFPRSLETLTDKDLESFPIEQFKSEGLKKLRLNLHSCFNLTDQSLPFFGTKICKKWPNLEQIDFNFASCQRMNEKGIKSLAYRIKKNLPNLRKVILCFAGCPNVTFDLEYDMMEKFSSLLEAKFIRY